MFNAPPLYAITDSTLLVGEKLLPAVAAAIRGGARWIQYRDKSGDSDKRITEAKALKTLCEQLGARLLINDDVSLASAIGAHGVHLGQGDMALTEARQILGPDSLIGITCHASLELAQKAAAEGADYLAFGRFFPSATKPEAPPAPLSLLAQARDSFDLPLVAIGGITPENAASLRRSGATTLAVCHSLFAADDVESRARSFSA